MAFNWPPNELTVRKKVGIGTDTPSTELDVIGSISATNLTLNGNLKLGPLSVEEFSNDGNLTNNSDLAVPTERAVKSYVDAQLTPINNALNGRASLNGDNNQDFNTRNLSVRGDLKVSGNLEVQGSVIARDTEHIAGNVSLGDEDGDEVKITGVLRSGHSSKTLIIDDGLTVNGKLGIGTNQPRNSLGIRGIGNSEELISFEAPNGATKWHINQNLRGNRPGLNFVETGVADGRLFIEQGGNVGIGTTNPRAKLEVSGDVHATGKLSSQNGKVKRDFLTWNTTQRTSIPIHIKTNIPKQSNVMYRIAVEGYNYGVAAIINSDVVGYTYSGWDHIGQAQTNNYADGVAISQYYSSDGYVVIKLTTGDTYYIGFSVSAWFTNPAGRGFDISAKVHHQATDL